MHGSTKDHDGNVIPTVGNAIDARDAATGPTSEKRLGGRGEAKAGKAERK